MDKKEAKSNPKLSIEGDSMEVELKTYGLSVDNKVNCTLNLYFSAEPDEIVPLLKLLGKLNDLREKTYNSVTDNNKRIFLTDIWVLDLTFKEFKKEIIE